MLFAGERLQFLLELLEFAFVIFVLGADFVALGFQFVNSRLVH